MSTISNEDEEKQDSSVNNNYKTNANNLGKNEETDERSNPENRETESDQLDEYRTRKVIRTQRWLESREQ